MTFWRQAWAVCRRDLLIEGRAGEVSAVVLPFAAVAVFVVPLSANALDSRFDDLLAEVAAPVYWLVALLFGMQVALRQTAGETPTQRRHLVLLGIDPFARFTGRAAAGALLILVVLVVTAPLVVLFYDPDPVPPPLPALPVLAGFAVGLSLLATLAGDITVGVRARSALAPLIVAPLAVPLLVGASRALDSLARGRSTLTGTLLLVIADLALAATAALAASPLEEATT